MTTLTISSNAFVKYLSRFHLIALGLCFMTVVSSGRADELGEFLKESPIPERSWLNAAQDVIERNQADPRVLRLRLRYIGQTLGLSRESSHFNAVIGQLEVLIRDAGTQNSDIAFEAAMLKGLILCDCLNDRRSGYNLYKTLESHPHLVGRDLATDYDRTALCLRIAEVALSMRELNEAEMYSRLVMAYPHLGMEDRIAYARFYALYEAAGSVLLSAVSADLPKLSAIEIFPSHPRLMALRTKLLSARTNEMLLDVPNRLPESSVVPSDRLSAGSPHPSTEPAVASSSRGSGVLSIAGALSAIATVCVLVLYFRHKHEARV